MAIGNAPWPIGVTMVGIHARTGREKIFSKHVAHVLNDETQRKYIQVRPWHYSTQNGIKNIIRVGLFFFKDSDSHQSLKDQTQSINDYKVLTYAQL